MVHSDLLRRLEQLLPDLWRDRLTVWAERARGLDLSRPISKEDLGHDPSLHIGYSPTDDRHLRSWFDGFTVRPTDRLLDYGCGKGRAMRTMLRYPFDRVDGVELSRDLAETARRNLTRLGISQSRWRVFEADATTFEDLDGYTYFYLYNPFAAPIVRQVVKSILASIDRAPREVVVMYHNPECAEEFVSTGRFVTTREPVDREGQRTLVMVATPSGRS